MLKSIKKDARVAGLLYLIVVLSGIFSLLYVPSELISWESSAETLQNIKSNEFLFKIGILGDLIMYTTFMFLSLALYKLLGLVHKHMASIMVILVVVSVAISYANLVPKFDVISLIGESSTSNTINADRQADQVLSMLQSHSNGISMIQIFWGLWLFPFGYLVWKSNFLPKFFSVLLMIGCFGYLTDFIGYFLFPEAYDKSIIPIIAAIPHAVGEIGICLWLVIVGARVKSENRLSQT